MMHRRRRSGAEAIEFALTAVVFVPLVIGLFEYSWVYFVRSTVVNAVRDGCRAGAVIPQDEAPHAAAEESMRNILATWGTSCSESSNNCVFVIGDSGLYPEVSIDCELTVTYEPIFELIPVPNTLSAQSTVLYEVQ